MSDVIPLHLVPLGLTEEPSNKSDSNSVKQRRVSKKAKEDDQKRTAETIITEQ